MIEIDNNLSEHLKNELLCHTADIVGFGDLSGLPEDTREGLSTGMPECNTSTTVYITNLTNMKDSLLFRREYIRSGGPRHHRSTNYIKISIFNIHRLINVYML